jgi:uncharacterized protein
MIRRSPEPAPAASGEIGPIPLEEFDRWLRRPRQRQPVAESLSMLDGFIAAIVAGAATYEPIAWLCPLGVSRGATHDSATEIGAVFAVTVAHYNASSATLSGTPERFAPILRAMRRAPLTLGRGAAAFMPPSS